MLLRLLPLALALGCTTSPPREHELPPVTPTPPPATLEPGAPAYDVHEWGLVDYVLASRAHELAAGPGLFRAPSDPTLAPTPTPTTTTTPTTTPTLTPTTTMRPNPHAATRKPVVYFHLREGSASVTVNAIVGIHAGRVVEHWPPGEVMSGTVSWPGIAVAGEPCTGLVYPSRDDARCRGVPDGYCELAEIAAYETADASCLTFGGARYNHLFYRGAASGRDLPLRVTRNPDGSLDVENASLAGPVPLLARLVRGDAGTSAWVGEVPAQGARLQVPVPTDGAALPAARRGVGNALRGLGLTPAEAQAFERAWSAELFENGGTNGAPVVRDALLFFLPPALTSEWSSLEFVPPPASLVRVLAVRVDVGG